MKIIISGIGGKIGKSLTYIISKSQDLELVAGIDKYCDKSFFEVPVFDTFAQCNVKADAVIDFSRAVLTEELLDYCVKNKLKLVIGTTGHTEQQLKAIEQASFSIPIFKSSNMSLGVNLLINLSKQAARFFGNSFDIEVVEYHHNMKVDSPSGTAISIANGINEVFDNKKEFVYGRHGNDDKRKTSDIGINSIRGGTIVGRHDVMFIGTDEIVTLQHEAGSRDIFCYGAIRALKYISEKPYGLFNMTNIIGADYSVTNVSTAENVALVSMSNVRFSLFSKVLDLLGQKKINLDMISQTAGEKGLVNISFSIDLCDVAETEKTVAEICPGYYILKNVGKLNIEGAGMEHSYGIAAQVTKFMTQNEIFVNAITTSETKISLCVNMDKLYVAQALLKEYFDVKM